MARAPIAAPKSANKETTKLIKPFILKPPFVLYLLIITVNLKIVNYISGPKTWSKPCFIRSMTGRFFQSSSLISSSPNISRPVFLG